MMTQAWRAGWEPLAEVESCQALLGAGGQAGQRPWEQVVASGVVVTGSLADT